jgi:dihydrofolate reductase
VVFSNGLESVTWNNSRIVAGDVAEEVGRLKQQPCKDLVLFGSSQLASTFLHLDLIDEYRFVVCPIVLGAGKLLFVNLRDRKKFGSIKTESFGSGTVCLFYAPA